MSFEKRKSLNSVKSAKSVIDYLKDNKIDFKIISSTYTTEIVCKIPFFNIKYIEKEHSPIAFICYQKIKKDIELWETNPLNSKPVIDKSNCIYFDYSASLGVKKNKVYKGVVNLDLTSAYATILRNCGMISEETYLFISKVPKQARLMCVGMLASNKKTFICENGIFCEKPTEKINPLFNYFFFCVDETARIMRDISARLDKDFIFTWVDGIYYFDTEIKTNTFFIENWLKEINIKCKVKDCYNFIVDVNKTRAMIQFNTEPDYTRETLKVFNLPLKTTGFNRDLLKYYNLI